MSEENKRLAELLDKVPEPLRTQLDEAITKLINYIGERISEEHIEALHYCPQCGELLDMDPDGGWCSACETYWDKYELEEKEEEEKEEGFE